MPEPEEPLMGLGTDAYASHGSGIAIPAILDRLFFAGENIREGCRLSTLGTPNIEPFINARVVLYIEVFGILRSSFTKDEREPIETEFKQLHELIMEIMKPPENRKLHKLDTMQLYEIVSDRLTKQWFLLNDFLQGKKQFYIRTPSSKDDLFINELESLKRQLRGTR